MDGFRLRTLSCSSTYGVVGRVYPLGTRGAAQGVTDTAPFAELGRSEGMATSSFFTEQSDKGTRNAGALGEQKRKSGEIGSFVGTSKIKSWARAPRLRC